MTTKEGEYNSITLQSLIDEIPPLEAKRVSSKMKIAARIDDARRNLGWNRQKLATELGQSPSVITKWLSGTHNFTVNTIVEIEEIMNIKLLSLEVKQQNQVVKYKVHVNNPMVVGKPWTYLCSFTSNDKQVKQSSSFKQFYLREK